MKRKILAFLLVVVMVVGMLPLSVFAADRVPLDLTITSYGAPFMNRNTGEHTVNSVSTSIYVNKSDVGSNNASGSATARFVGSNESGWELWVDVEIGNYKGSIPVVNAKITNKDMSKATGSITFGMSFNTSGGVRTSIHINGAKDLPAPEKPSKDFIKSVFHNAVYVQCDTVAGHEDKYALTLFNVNEPRYSSYYGYYTCGVDVYSSPYVAVNFNNEHKAEWGEHTATEAYKTFTFIWDAAKKEWKLPEGTDTTITFHATCDAAPEAPTYETIKVGNTFVYVECKSSPTEHWKSGYILMKDSYTVDSDGPKKNGDGQYTCDILVSADKYIDAFNKIKVNNVPYGQHELDTTSTSPMRVSLTYDAAAKLWKPTVEGTTITFNVKCENKPAKPTAEDIDKFHEELYGFVGEWAVMCLCQKYATYGEHDVGWHMFSQAENKTDANPGYTLGEVVENPGTYRYASVSDYPWMCVMTIPSDFWLAEYNTNADELGLHRLADGESATHTIHWFYSEKNGAWNWYESTPVVIKVTCDGVEPEIPEPTLANIDAKVDIICKNETTHNGSYALKAGAYTLTDNGDGTWNLSVNNTQLLSYMQDFVTVFDTHSTWSDRPGITNITLAYDKNTATWKSNANKAITFYVECESEPEISKPTQSDFEAGTLLMICDTDDEHSEYQFSYSNGSYTITWQDGSERCTLIFNVDSYVASYNVDHPGHTAVPNQNVTMTATYRSGKWKLDDVDRPKIHVTCESEPEIPDAPTATEFTKGLSVTVKCLNPTTGEHDCTDCTYGLYAGTINGYELVKVDDFHYTAKIPVTNFVSSYSKRDNIAHNLFSADTLTYNVSYENGKWTALPENRGVDDTILVTHAPSKWKEVGKFTTQNGGIGAICSTENYGPITYGLTTAFVYYNTDVVSVVYNPTAKNYTATIKTDKYVDAIGKSCNENKHPDDPRSHKLISAETVSWIFDVFQDEGNVIWTASPCTDADSTITVVHDLIVTFDPDNGGSTFTQNVFDGETATKPADPTKKGYYFDGWYLGENVFVFATPITEDITLKAHWRIKDDLTATVYYLEKDTEKELAESLHVENLTFGSDYTAEILAIVGYNYDSAVPENRTVTIDDEEENVIKLYYTARTDITYTVRYLDIVMDREIAKPKVVTNQTFGTVVTEKPIDIPNYVPYQSQASIRLQVDNNEIRFYYAFSNPNAIDTKPETKPEEQPELNTAEHYAYMVGYPDNTIRPESDITRAEVATIFFRLLTETTREKYRTDDNAFSDVNRGDWFNRAISTLANAGIVDGYEDGTFRPDEPITRGEMAKIIAQFDTVGTTAHLFTDSEGHWSEAYIALAAGNGWILGYEDGSFKPEQNITRAEVMVMINRVLNRMPGTLDNILPLNTLRTFTDLSADAWYYVDVLEATNTHGYTRTKEQIHEEKWIDRREDRDWSKLEEDEDE